jgi:hypothetical protein
MSAPTRNPSKDIVKMAYRVKSMIPSKQIKAATIEDVSVLSGLICHSYRDVARRFGLTPKNCPKHPSKGGINAS